MRENEIGCAAVFKLAVDVVNIAVGVRGDAGTRFVDEFFAVAIFQSVGRAGFHAGRFLAVVNPLWAERAFIDERAFNDAFVIIKVRDAKRTGVHAITAANTQVRIVGHRAIFGFRVGAYRAG